MVLKVNHFSVRRKVNVLKKPRPTYVSLVDHAATQTPFAVVKRADVPSNGEEVMKNKRTNKKSATATMRTPPTRTAKSGDVEQTAQVYKLSFDKKVFKSEESVKSWLKKNQWSTGNAEVADEDGEFVVKAKDAKDEDKFDLHEVALDEEGSVSALVAKSTSNLGKSALRSQKNDDGKKGADGMGDTNFGQTAEDEEEDPDGTKTAGTKEENAAEDDADEDDADADDDADDDDGDGSASDDDDTSADPDEDEDDDAADDGDADEDDNYDNVGSDDDAEGAEDAAGVDDPEGYGDNRPGKGSDDGVHGHRGGDGKEGHRSIREKESKEPLPKDLPGQRITPTGVGKPGHEPGNPGKYRIQRRKSAGRNPIKAIDQFVRKYDSYGVYLSGEVSLSGVLKDGMVDGIPPGVSEIFQSLYKAVGNTLKGDSASVSKDVGAIAGEFVEGVLAVHEVWKTLLDKGTKTQKKAAKAYFAGLGSDLQTIAKSEDTTEKALETAVAKAIAPLQARLEQTSVELNKFKKGAIPSRKSFGSDDTNRTESESARRRKEEQEDEDFLATRNQKSILGTRTRAY